MLGDCWIIAKFNIIQTECDIIPSENLLLTPVTSIIKRMHISYWDFATILRLIVITIEILLRFYWT